MLALVCALAVLVAGTPAGAEPVATTTSRSSIVIGVSCVQTGPSRELGSRLMWGSAAYFERVNELGGLHGRQVQLIVKDDRYEPEPAVSNTHELITHDNAFFLFNYVGTPTLTRVLPLLKYYQDRDIVNVAPFTGAEPQRNPPYDKFVFNIRASYRDETRALVEHLVARGHQRIGFFGQADAYGKSGEIGVIDALKAHRLQLSAIATYRRNQDADASMAAQVEILRRSGAQAVIAVGVYGPCAAFIREARLAGWNVPIANVSFVAADMLLDQLNEYSRQVGQDLSTNLINSQVVPSPAEASLPLVRNFRKAMPNDAHRSFIALEGWLNAVVVTEALRRAGPEPTRRDFIRAMESLGGWDPGLGVPLEFTAANHQGLRRVWLTQVRDGQWISMGDQKGRF